MKSRRLADAVLALAEMAVSSNEYNPRRKKMNRGCGFECGGVMLIEETRSVYQDGTVVHLYAAAKRASGGIFRGSIIIS